MKDLTDDKINATQKLNFVLGRVENIVGKGENAGYQLFLLFLQCSQNFFYTGSLKDDKRNVTQKLNFVLGRVENIFGNQLFLLFPQCFQKFS